MPLESDSSRAGSIALSLEWCAPTPFNERLDKRDLRATIPTRAFPGNTGNSLLLRPKQRRDDAQKGRQADPHGRPGAAGVRNTDDADDADERLRRGRERFLQRVHTVSSVSDSAAQSHVLRLTLLLN